MHGHHGQIQHVYHSQRVFSSDGKGFSIEPREKEVFLIKEKSIYLRLDQGAWFDQLSSVDHHDLQEQDNNVQEALSNFEYINFGPITIRLGIQNDVVKDLNIFIMTTIV